MTTVRPSLFAPWLPLLQPKAFSTSSQRDFLKSFPITPCFLTFGGSLHSLGWFTRAFMTCPLLASSATSLSTHSPRTVPPALSPKCVILSPTSRSWFESLTALPFLLPPLHSHPTQMSAFPVITPRTVLEVPLLCLWDPVLAPVGEHLKQHYHHLLLDHLFR